MSDTPQKKSHPWVWVLSLAVLLPLLYLLGAAPVEMAIYHDDPVTYLNSPTLHGVFATRNWLCEHGPLKGMLIAYDKWWFQRVFQSSLTMPPEPTPGVGGVSR